MIWGLKCHQNNSQMVRDGYAQYEEAEVDRLVATVESRYNAVVGDRIISGSRYSGTTVLPLMVNT